MPLTEAEELELLELEEAESKAKSKPKLAEKSLLQPPDKVTASGIPESILSGLKKAEGWYIENIDPRLKGRELFSDEAMAKKKEALPYIAGGLGVAAGVSAAPNAALSALKFGGKALKYGGDKAASVGTTLIGADAAFNKGETIKLGIGAASLGWDALKRRFNRGRK